MARRSSQEWQTIIEQQKASCLSNVEFCRRQQRKQATAFVKVTKVATQSPMMTLKIGDATCCYLLIQSHCG
jgi:hypothetical protein